MPGSADRGLVGHCSSASKTPAVYFIVSSQHFTATTAELRAGWIKKA